MPQKKQKNIISQEHQGGGLKSMSENICSLAQKLLGNKGMTEIEILAQWKNIVGAELSQTTLPMKIDFKRGERTDGVLHLMCQTGADALEIQHKSQMIIEKVNTFFGYKAVAQIKTMQNASLSLNENPIKNEDNPNKNLVSAQEENYIKQIVKDVQNEGLKSRLESLGNKIFGHKK